MAARAARVVRGALVQVPRASPAKAMAEAEAAADMEAGGDVIAAVAVVAVRRAG